MRMGLADTLEKASKRRGIDCFGVASLASAREFIVRQGGDSIAAFPTAISIGIVLPGAIVDLLPKREEPGIRQAYRHHAYDVVNQRLDAAASELASAIQRAGSRAFPIAAAQRMDGKGLHGLFSHKIAAHLAGLGWIGKSCLLVTLEHGPRVRWATVLTDASLLPSSARSVADRCGDCRACVDACPVQAFTGKPFKSDETREARFDAKKCDAYFNAMEERGQVKVCGMCLYACPFGIRLGGTT
jgi:epoxyqueuosine reductase